MRRGCGVWAQLNVSILVDNGEMSGAGKICGLSYERVAWEKVNGQFTGRLGR